MADISKASRIIEKDMRFREQDPAIQAERQRVIDALKHGNIHEVFAKETRFKIGDFTDFFSGQWKNFRSQIIQDTEIKAEEGSYHPPSVEDFPVHHKGTTITPDEGDLLVQSMMDFATSGTGAHSGGGKFMKAQTLEGGDMPAADVGMTPEDIAQGALSDWDVLLDETWGQIFDAQLSEQMQSEMGRVKSEVQRILALVKSGAIGPEFALIALAKVNQTRNGVLMSGLGKKMFHMNEQMNRVTEELYGGGGFDMAAVQTAQTRTREIAQQQNLLTTDMQKVMQDTSDTISSVKSMMDLLKQGKEEMIRKMSV